MKVVKMKGGVGNYKIKINGVTDSRDSFYVGAKERELEVFLRQL